MDELIDVTHTLIFEDAPSLFEEDSALDLIESAFQLMEDYVNENPTAISEPDFHETLMEEIQDIFNVQFEDNLNDDDFEEDNGDDVSIGTDVIGGKEIYFVCYDF